MKKKYEVEISRTSWAFKTFIIEASSEKEAEELALEQAYNEVFTSGNAEYEVENIVEIG